MYNPKGWFRNAPVKQWVDWKWQQQNAFRDIESIADYFPKIDRNFFCKLKEDSPSLKFKITPYILSQFDFNSTEEKLMSSPWFKEFFPQGKIYACGYDAYNGTDNWEFSEEFPTSMLQHKYTNKAILRFPDCFSYCSFCFEALRVLEKRSKKHVKLSDWKATLDYLKAHPQIEEIIFSGGDPLFMPDTMLEKFLKDLSKIKTVRFKRIHTRTLTHNPFRITNELLEILAKYKVNAISLNVTHPAEITPEFKEAAKKIRTRLSPILVSQIALFKGINNNKEILRELFLKLYENNIKPYYLFHAMPHTPFADKQRTSVKEGLCLIKQLKRHLSNIAIPEYVIVHYTGKKTVPEEPNGTPKFQYRRNKAGKPIIRFVNWKGNWVEYPDAD